MKYCIDKYPKGSFPYQKDDGKYIDGALYYAIQTLADTIVDDMTFLGILYSSTLEVGTGKSTLAQTIGECYTEMINLKHKDKLEKPIEFGIDNIVFCPEDLIERSFKLPKYSCIILDEWEDAHYWSKLGITLRQFFRKCRQLNLFMIAIIPNFFQMPLPYAVGRSVFAIDVKFGDNFQRGFFSLYNFERKKDLYIRGKKEHNYHVVRDNFHGVFTDGYAIEREVYLKRKRDDLNRYEDLDTALKGKVDKNVERIINLMNYFKLDKKECAKAMKVSERTIRSLFKTIKDGGIPVIRQEEAQQYNTPPNYKVDDDVSGGDDEEETKDI